MSQEKILKIGFIGAGNVNFGGHGNAWDHASRVEKIPNIVVVGIAELCKPRAEDVLAKRKAKKKEIWGNAKVFEDYRDMLRETKPDAVFIGLPPSVHGSPKFPVELECIKAGAHILVEKPLSCLPPEQLQEYSQELCNAEKNGIVISVAYMFRYSKVIRTMKELANSLGPIRYFNARYHCAYTNIAEPWWNSTLSGGPIVEQATHFFDLARYFCGEIDEKTIKCTSISAIDRLSELSSIPVNEEKIPVENRVNRVTSSLWKFESGAVGNLTHTVLLHGWKYELQIELFGDGYYIYVHNPYDECRISVRKPGSEQEEITSIPDDPYLHEVETFLEAVRTGDSSKITSTFADAFKTYKLTWEIQQKCKSQ